MNSVSRMYREGVFNVELIGINTDAQSLKIANCAKKILIGRKITGGLGAGMDVRLGETAARENIEDLKKMMAGAEIIFLTCGLGGGSGTSGIVVLAEAARSLGILTIAVCTLPFSFEGRERKRVALWGLNKLRNKVDSLMIIPNDKILELAGAQTTVEHAFWLCDSVLREAVKGISDLVSLPGIISLNFADLKSLLKNSGRSFLGIGVSRGDKRAITAAQAALTSPLLDFSIKDSQGIILNIVGGDDLSLAEVNSAAETVKMAVKKGTKIIFGVSDDPNLKSGDLKLIVIATSQDKN